MDPEPLFCIRCPGRLERAGAGEFLCCSVCHGAWFDNPNFSASVEPSSGLADATALPGCIRCADHRPLRPLKYSEARELEILTCIRGHGAWADGSSFQALEQMGITRFQREWSPENLSRTGLRQTFDLARLPFFHIFTDPVEAIRSLAANPPVTLIVIFAIATAASVILRNRFHWVPELHRFLLRPGEAAKTQLQSAAFEALKQMIRLLCLHFFANSFNPGRRFQAIGSVSFFLSSFAALVSGFFLPLRWVIFATLGWRYGMEILATREVYRFRWLQTGLIWGFSFLVYSLIAMELTAVVYPGRATRHPRGPRLEAVNIAPSLKWRVQDMDGKPLEIERLRGHAVVVNFWATWCVPCRMELPTLDRLYRAVQADGVRVLAISDEPPATVLKFAKRSRIHLPFYTLAGERPVGFESEGIPATFILAPDGHMVARKVGSAHWDDPVFIESLKVLQASGTLPSPSGRR